MITNIKNEKDYDSGWIDLPLEGNVQNYSSTSPVQIRRIGNLVSIRGRVTNISAENTIIGYLPTNFRPTGYTKVYSAFGNATQFFRTIIAGSNGQITATQTSNSTYSGVWWYDLMCEFIVD